jgi:hypothetical protein
MAAQAFSDFLEDKILDLFIGTNITAPTNLWVGLFTTLPGDTGSGGAPADGTEATGNGYARVSVGTISTWLSAKSTVNTTQRHRTNANILTFPLASGAWGGNIIGWGVWDAATVGNLWFYGTTTSLAVVNGMTPSIAVGGVDIGTD